MADFEEIVRENVTRDRSRFRRDANERYLACLFMEQAFLRGAYRTCAAWKAPLSAPRDTQFVPFDMRGRFPGWSPFNLSPSCSLPDTLYFLKSLLQ